MSQDVESRVYIGIVYRLPTYASDAFPRLAHELIEHIADFLWDEPVQLTACCLVCHAWYHAARRHLRTALRIRSNNDLRDLVHILMSTQNGKYGQILHFLFIEDDAQQAFAHTHSVRIPGCLLPSLNTLRFSYLDWTAVVRPHASFFTCLTYFTSVTNLHLHACHFKSGDGFHRVINTLPHLKRLTLYNITISSKLREGFQAAPQRRFPRSKLTCVWISPSLFLHLRSAHATHTELPVQPQQNHSFLNALLSYSTITSVHVTVHHVTSFSQLQRLIRGFPALRDLQLEDNPVWELPEVSTETALLRTDLSIDAWPMLGLSRMSSVVMLRFLELFTTQYPKVGQLSISVLGLSSPALARAVEKVMRESGPALTLLEWLGSSHGHDPFVESSEDQIAPEPIPAPQLTYNTSLERLVIQIFVSTVYQACTSLMKLLSHIESTHLRELGIFINCLPLGDTNLSVKGGTESITAFRAILCRPVFAGLLKGATLSFIFGNDPDNIRPFAKDMTSAKIKSIMVPLLAPWLARGVLQVHLPDGSTVDDVPPDIAPAAPAIDDDASARDGALRLTG